VIRRARPAPDLRKKKLAEENVRNLPQLDIAAWCMEQVIINLLSNAGKISSEGRTILIRATI
jgi:K+-sensing histidine kinase KdpD